MPYVNIPVKQKRLVGAILVTLAQRITTKVLTAKVFMIFFLKSEV